MEKEIENFFGLDAIASEQAKLDLIAFGKESLHLVINQFYKRSLNSHITMQLSDLFGHFGNIALPQLMLVFETGGWHAMTMVTPCFSKLPHEPAGSRLMDIVFSGDVDKERLAIEAIGYLGTSEWSFKLIKKVADNHSYDWEKLSYYLFVTFFRIAIQCKMHDEIKHSFYYVEAFYKLAGAEKFKRLWNNNWYSMEIIFSDFKPVAADIIILDWLKHNDSFFRELGLKALGWMRLNRAVNVIKQMALSGKETERVKRQCADSLSMIDSLESAKALKQIYQATEQTSELYRHIALYTAMSLGHLADRDFIEQIYPELVAQDEETEAHTLYNLGFLGFNENAWIEGLNSGSYIVRASVATVYARRRGTDSIPKLLQMEREASHEIEKALILSALMVAGNTSKKEEFLNAIYQLNRRTCLRMLRITWKREIVFALHLVEDTHSEIWERMAGVNMTQLLYEIAELENSLKEPKKSTTQLTGGFAPQLSNAYPSKEIFISYSWGGESEEIADKICELFVEKELHIIRDKIVLGYKGNIKEFMKRIGLGRYVIIIINDKYLKSDNCMYEMLQLKNREDLHKRIFPIVLNDATIYSESERLDYIIYWERAIDKLNEKVKELNNLAGTSQVIEKVSEYQDIRRIIDEITNLLRNMNTLSPHMHKNDNFSELINAINKAMTQDDILSNK